MRGVDLEVNGLSVNTLIVTSDSRCLGLDLALHVAKVVEPPVGDMVKLCPLGSASSARGPIRIALGIGSAFIFGDIDELEDQGPTSADATSSR